MSLLFVVCCVGSFSNVTYMYLVWRFLFIAKHKLEKRKRDLSPVQDNTLQSKSKKTDDNYTSTRPTGQKIAQVKPRETQWRDWKSSVLTYYTSLNPNVIAVLNAIVIV